MIYMGGDSMTNRELIAMVAEDYGITQKEAKKFVEKNKEALKEYYKDSAKKSFYED